MIEVTYFHNLQISRFISNPLWICINDAFQINAQKSNHDFKEKYPNVRVDTLVSMCFTDI